MRERDEYVEKLLKLKDTDLIKVITGVRRCGKSTILLLYKDKLIKNGISKGNIIYMNFESLEFNELKNYVDLYNFLKSKIKNNKKYYILLDEVQNIEGWEKTINSIRVDFNTDITITGSNAYLLSGELATLLSGRYITVNIYPLSFKEYLYFDEYTKNLPITERFNVYLNNGGIPYVYATNEEFIREGYLTDIFSTIIMKDILMRNNVRDYYLLEDILKYVAFNTGNIISSKKITDYLNSNGRKTNNKTVENYLKMLENAYIIYKCNRYDIKGKLILKTLPKYYIVDNGLKNVILNGNKNKGFALETIIFFELLRRGYKVNVGKLRNSEVDFIASNSKEELYIQVSLSISNEETFIREINSLQTIDSSKKKLLIVLEDVNKRTNYCGIEIINVIDFLLQ